MSKERFKKFNFYEIYPASFYDSNNDGIRKNNSVLIDNRVEITKKGRTIIIDRGTMTIYLNCSHEKIEITGKVVVSTKEIKNNFLPSFSAAIVEK